LRTAAWRLDFGRFRRGVVLDVRITGPRPGAPGPTEGADVQFTSSPRRALGLVAVGAIGMSTAVLGVTGVAHAAPLAPITFTAADSPLTIPAGYCTVDWKLVGGQGGASEDGVPGAKGGELVTTTDVRSGQQYQLMPGAAGWAGAAGIGGAGGVSPDGAHDGLRGEDAVGTAGGGGGAATVVRSNGSPILFAFSGNGGNFNSGTSAGSGQGNGENRVSGSMVNTTVTTATGDGSVSGTVKPCLPGTPTVNWIFGGQNSATLQISRGMIPENATVTYEYSLDNGAWKTLVTGNEYQYEPTITGLVYGTTYSVRVRATTDGGSSEPTVAQTVTPTIGAPTALKATTGPGSITITWGPPADPVQAADVQGYTAWALPAGQQSSSGLVECAEMNAAARSCTIGVPVGSEYQVGVRAMGPESYGESAFVTTAKIGGAVVSATLPKSNGTLGSSDADGKVVAGAQVTISGAGFLPGSTVELVVYSTPVKLGSVVVLADGTFSATVTVPANLTDGVHHLVATGVDVNGNARNLVVEVTVSGGTAVLAVTGFSALPYAGAGALALLAGGGLLVAARRRTAA
jgi:hypothetical protein